MAITIVHSHRISFAVRYISPTDTKGARVKAVHPNDKSIALTIQYETDDSYDECALAFCAKMGWTGKLIRGDDNEAAHYVFCD